jgi:hypothetical protein
MRALAACAICILAACAPSQSAATPSQSAPPAIASIPVPSATVNAATATPPGAAATAAPVPTAQPAATSPSTQRCERQSGGDQNANRVLSDVRAARQTGYDRVVFDFGSGPLPPFAVEQVDRVIQGGSGFVKPVAGNAFLVARFIQAGGAGEYRGTTQVRPDTQIVREVVLSTNFEGALEFGIGLSGPVCPRVSVLSSPARLVLDFQ